MRKMKIVVVTGGCGFIGSNLVARLRKMRSVKRLIVIDDLSTGSLSNVSHILLDSKIHAHLRCTVNAKWTAFIEEADTIFNLASPASPDHFYDPNLWLHVGMTNTEGTRHMLQLAQTVGAVFVQASTSEVYGDPITAPQSESYNGNVNCYGPRAIYDEGKRYAEALCWGFLNHHNVDARVARIFNTYGPRMRKSDGRLIPTLIRQALCGEPMTIHGSGLQTRSFCYVDDLVTGLIKLAQLEQNPHTPINLGNPTEYRTIREIARTIRRITASKSQFSPQPALKDDPLTRYPDISMAKEMLRWKPTTTLDVGLAQMVKWARTEN